MEQDYDDTVNCGLAQRTLDLNLKHQAHLRSRLTTLEEKLLQIDEFIVNISLKDLQLFEVL